jgi:hypothetical protein
MKMILCGEAALEQFLGINVVNYNLTEKGWYNSKGLNQGKVLIKVFPQGTFPIIYQHNTKPMVFVMQMDSRNYRICGYAKTQVLNSYKSVQMVPKTEYDFDRKACFYGFDELKDFTEMDVLEAVLGG